MKNKKFNPISFSEVKQYALKDVEIKKQYENLEEEFLLVKVLLNKRLEKKLTQKQLAEKIGTRQASIARLESGSYNPSFKFLKKVAKALDSKLVIKFESIN